jgi:hypothetical protein
MAETLGHSAAGRTCLQYENQLVDMDLLSAYQMRTKAFDVPTDVSSGIFETIFRRRLTATIQSQPFFFQGSMAICGLSQGYFFSGSDSIETLC